MKTNIISNKLPSRAGYVLGAVGLFVATLLPSLNIQQAQAAQIEARKLTLASSASGLVSTDLAGNAVDPGDPGNGAQTSHTFEFAVPAAATTVQSIEFAYCTQPMPDLGCIAPDAGDTDLFTVDNITGIASQSGTGGTPFVFDSSTVNTIRVDRTFGTTYGSGATFEFTFGSAGTGWITNPANDNETFFVQITLFTDNNFASSRDIGTVASSTAQQIDILARVQEKLNFSVGKDAPDPPDAACLPKFTDDGGIELGDGDNILDSAVQYDNHSYFRISTNALNGTTIQYSGNTLESGSNDIDPINPKTISTAGIEGFGIGFDSGADSGASHSFAQLTAAANYGDAAGVLGTPGVEFFFDNASATAPVTLASSTEPIVCDTGAIRYVANIATTTAAGVYTTTITYIAVPAF